MGDNIRRRLLLFLLLDDEETEAAILLLLHWRECASPRRYWLLRKRLTVERILRERRIGMQGFIEQTIHRYPDIQFYEHFRMRRSTFQV